MWCAQGEREGFVEALSSTLFCLRRKEKESVQRRRELLNPIPARFVDRLFYCVSLGDLTLVCRRIARPERGFGRILVVSFSSLVLIWLCLFSSGSEFGVGSRR